MSGCRVMESVGNSGAMSIGRKAEWQASIVGSHPLWPTPRPTRYLVSGVASPAMNEYQAVILKLTRHVQEDEDALTDLLNERSRSGWELAMMAQGTTRLTVVFCRRAAAPPNG